MMQLSLNDKFFEGISKSSQ